MYAEGGVYLDIKSSVTRPFDSLLQDDDAYILSCWNNVGWGRHQELKGLNSGRGEYQQWHIIAVRGHPFLRAVILKIIANIQGYRLFVDGVGKFGVLRVTGPIPYTMAILPIEAMYPCRRVDIENDFGVVYSIYESQSKKGGHKKLFKKHYSQLKVPVVTQGWFLDWIAMLLWRISKPFR
jgi:hypothetical protein